MSQPLIEAILAEKPSTTLFHYTSQEGLLGILKTKALWASNIHYSNDAAELAYAMELVQSTLDNALRSERGPFNDWYGAVLEELDTIRHVNLFAFSLSEQGDLLSQWRGYCPEGIGFSIGFEYDDLLEPMKRQEFRLVKCVYDLKQHQQIIVELGEPAIACLDNPNQQDRSARLKQAVQIFLDGLIRIGPIMKHPSFHEEREWRLISGTVSIKHPNIRLRPGKNMLVPYFEFGLAKANGEVAVSTVHVGPNPHMYLSMQSVIAALTSLGITFHNVRRSEVPYRGW